MRIPVVLLVVGLGLASILASAGGAEDGQGGEDARLLTFFKDFLEKDFQASPMNATRLGDHRFDHLLDDLSPEARAANLERYRRTLAELPRKVDYPKLSRGGQIDFEILKHHLARSVWLAENFNPFEQDPRVYNEFISESTYLLLTQSAVPRAARIKNCVARMREIPRIVETAKQTLKNPPRQYLETAINQNQGSLKHYLVDLFHLAEETPQLSELGPPAKKVVEVLRDYDRFLKGELLPRATGEWRIGKEKFARKLELELDAAISADEVLKDAEAEAARVEHEMYVIARQLWSTTVGRQAPGAEAPGSPLPPDDADGRRQTIQRVLAELAKNHGKPEHLVRDAIRDVEEIKAFISSRNILRLPERDCRIIEMPEFQRGNWTAYCNPAPPLNPKAASFYAISPPPAHWEPARVASYLEEYNRHMLKILTIHEAYPGHYVQLEYSNRHPSLIRRVLGSGVFAEGWAVYTEQMMLDQGFGNGDPALRLHQLKFYLRAVINAILDHKMHCMNMTDAEALDLLMKRGFQSEGEAVGKVVRSKQSSCQLSTYFVGRMAFYRLRQQLQREMGDSFDLGRYHEAVLAHGTLPVKYLPELVRARLKEGQ